MSGKTFKLNRYVAEAKADAFALEIAEDEVLLIPAPDGDTMLAVEEAPSSRRRLALLCGEHYDRVRELVGPAPAGVLNALVTDMMEHWGLVPTPPGGFPGSPR